MKHKLWLLSIFMIIAFSNGMCGDGLDASATDHFVILKDGKVLKDGKADNAFQIYVIGDSIAWGNGLNQENKIYFKVAKDLHESLNMPVEVTVYAHSGAVISETTDNKKNPNLNSGYPTIKDQAEYVSKDADLILVSGGINDVGINNIFDANTQATTIASRSADIKNDMEDLLKYLKDKTAENDAKIIVTGYYRIITEESNVELQDQAIAAALSVTSEKTKSQASNALALSAVERTGTAATIASSWYLIGGIAHNIENLRQDNANLKANSEVFYATSQESLMAAVRDANNGENRILFVDPLFQDKNGYGASESFLWKSTSLGKTNDEQFDERSKLVNQLDPNRMNAIAHPNVDGAARYADFIVRIIESKGSDWLLANAEETTSAAVDALLLDTSQSNVELLKTSPTDTSQFNSLETVSSTSQSTSAPKFSIDSRVETTDYLNVRSGPGLSYATVSPTKPAGTKGRILNGSVFEDNFTWWPIQYDDGTRGWSQEKRLELAPTSQNYVSQSAGSVTQTTGQISEDTAKPSDLPSPSAVGPLPGQVKVDISVKDQWSLDAIPGAKVTAYDGNGVPVTVTWIGDGQAFAYGAPGEWKIISSAPGYRENIADVPAIISTRSDATLTKGESSDRADTQPIVETSSTSAGPLPGQVKVAISVKDQHSLDAIPGVQVNAIDGNGAPVTVTWTSDGQGFAYGAPGDWKIVSSAPGYGKNTAKVPATTSTRSDIALTKQPNVDSAISSYSEPEKLSVTQPVDPQPLISTQASQTNSIDNGQSSAKFIIPPGGQITGTDGAGRTFQETADENGYVAIPGSPGDWKLQVSAPGYETLTFNDYAFSGTEVYGGSGYVNLGLQKTKTENHAPEQAIAYFDVQKGGVVGPVLVPGAMITVQDGSGKIIEQQVDSNGHATIAGTAGLWQYAITAPGYATKTGYLSASGPSSASASANLEVDETGQSSAEQVSFDPLPAQVTEKFKAAPGTLITVTDGSGKKIEATADENGYAFITAAPGEWQWTTSAPGYLSSGPSTYLFTFDSRMDLPQTKDPNSQPASASMTPINEQPITQPIDPQSTLAEDENSLEAAQIAQESVQPEEGSPSQEGEPDMQLADRQAFLEAGKHIQEIPRFNFEPAQIDSLGEGLSPVMVPGIELLELPSISVADENIQETSQDDSESDWLGSTDTQTGPIDSVSTENFVPSALPYNNSTSGPNQTLADQTMQQTASAQPASQIQEEMLSQEQRDDISMDDFESQIQDEDPASEEANNLTS